MCDKVYFESYETFFLFFFNLLRKGCGETLAEMKIMVFHEVWKKIVLRKHLKNILIRLNSKVLQLKDDSQDVFNHSFNLIILFC